MSSILKWSLSDPGMGLLERPAWPQCTCLFRGGRIRPLAFCSRIAPGDLTPDSVTIRPAADDKTALTTLFEWAWQAPDGVFYLPGVHRSEESLQYVYKRVAMHNGIVRTFLQHPRVQPKGELIEQNVPLDEGQEIRIAYQPVDPAKIKPVDDLKRAGFFDRTGALTEDEVELSGWVFPGIAPRYGDEVAWSGSARIGILLMLAPIACLYQQLHSERGTWLFVIPDVHNLEAFDEVRVLPMLGLDPMFTDVASLSDAGLRFLAASTSEPARSDFGGGCRVVAMGKVGYYRSQSIRKGVVDVPRSETVLRRYRILHSSMGNRWEQRKSRTETSNEKIKKRKVKKKETADAASHFLAVPTVRGRIADNLIEGQPWYADLAEPLPWERDALEYRRKTSPGVSVERLWFNNLNYQRGALMELIQETEMWDRPTDRLFVEAFWQILSALYRREGEAVKRGGSREFVQRIEDLKEDIRRSLTRSKTRALLREVISDLFAKPVAKYRSPIVREHPAQIWQLIDEDWKRARDLALLALASYSGKEKRDAGEDNGVETPPPEPNGNES